MFNPLAKPLAPPKRPCSPLDISLARSRADLQQAFELTYRSYFRAGLAVDSPSGMRLTPFHLLTSSEVIIAKLDQTVVSTISLFGDGKLGLPMQSMYSREIETLRTRGLRLAEVGGLADRRATPKRFIKTFAIMGRIIVQLATARNYDTLVAAVHPKHAKLYKRVFGFKQIGDHTDCPYANGNPAEALYLPLDSLSPALHQQFFGEPFPSGHLDRFDWDPETRHYFERILNCDGKIAKAIGTKDYFDWGVTNIESPIDLRAGFESPSK